MRLGGAPNLAGPLRLGAADVADQLAVQGRAVNALIEAVREGTLKLHGVLGVHERLVRARNCSLEVTDDVDPTNLA